MNLARVLVNKKNRLLIERLLKMEATYVIGNHDVDLVGFVDTPLLTPHLLGRLGATAAIRSTAVRHVRANARFRILRVCRKSMSPSTPIADTIQAL